MMLFGRNRLFGQSDSLRTGGGHATLTGKQRFLAKKGIYSSDDLAARVQTAPRLFKKAP